MHGRVARGVVAASVLLSAWSVGATVAPCQPTTVARMSEATRGALAGILSQFPRLPVAGADDSLPHAWHIRMPRDTAGVDWIVIRHAVVRRLNARPRRGTDSRWSDLTIDHLRVSPDSIAFTITIGGGKRCGDGVVGSSATVAVAFARFAVPWMPRSTPIEVSDGGGCDLPASPAASPLPVVPLELRVIRPVPLIVQSHPQGRAREP